MRRKQQLQVLNRWEADGSEDGYLIKLKFEDEHIEKNRELPPHPLGRLPIGIEVVESDAPALFSVLTKSKEMITIYWVAEPATVTMRIY